MSTLAEILSHYGMPAENIASAERMINATYGAQRYLDGVINGIKADQEMAEVAKREAQERRKGGAE